MFRTNNPHCFGASIISNRKTHMPARIGKTSEPGVQVTKFGWMAVTRKRRSLERVIDSVNHT